MKAIINTKSNYRNLNGKTLEVKSVGTKTVTCIVEKTNKFPLNSKNGNDEVDFTLEEVTLID